MAQRTASGPRRLTDVGAEAVLIAGGGRAILLQLANPAVGHAVPGTATSPRNRCAVSATRSPTSTD